MSLLHRLDIATFYAVNNGFSHPALDVFFSFVTELKNYLAPIALLSAYLWFRKAPKGRYCLLALLLCVGLTDGISSHLVKHWVQRLRPCAALPHVLMPHGDRNTFSFPSSHAVNIAGAMTVLALYFPQGIPAYLAIAFIIGLSRVYLGLHYPSDVLAGYLLGGLLGMIAWRAVAWIEAAASARKPREV